MLRACSRCGKIHDSNFVCKHGVSRKFEKNNETRLRSKYSWKRKREQIKEESYNLCEVCKDQGDYHPKELEVHHIIKLKDYPDGLTVNDNLIALCVFHHKQADRGELDIDYLRGLAKKRAESRGQREIPPGL